jgi:DNA-binding beta-propeller fold protein YncE
VIDLRTQTVIRTIYGLKEPQGVGYLPSADMLYVANAGDGSVRLFQGADLSPSGRINLGDDADNIRVDEQANKVFIGYGKALAEIDPTSRASITEIPLKAHPEGFQLTKDGRTIYVNVPDARQVAFVDRTAGKLVTALPTEGVQSNFPMAIDESENRVLVVFRHPAKLMWIGRQSNAFLASADTCGDADDVFVDPKRQRAYVSCGEGYIDVFATREGSYSRIARIPTVSGARTSFLMPDLDRLFLAVRAAGSEPAAVWVFRPQPRSQ